MDGLTEVAFRIEENDIDGKHLVAIRDIPPGKLILNECPLAIGPPFNHASDDDICIVCLEDIGRPSVCGKCFWPICSSECGRTKYHRSECATLSACVRQSEDELLPLRHLLILRCVLLRNKDRYAWEKLMRLEDHHGVQSLIRTAEEELLDADRLDLKYFIHDICGMGGSALEKDVDTLNEIVKSSCIYVNCDKQGVKIEFPGLFLTAGLMSHSCLPNTRLMFDKNNNFQLSVFSSVKISKGDKITRCAVDGLLKVRNLDRKLLLQKLFIDCNCVRCSDPTELGSYINALLCQKCPSQNSPVIPIDLEEDQANCSDSIEDEKTIWQCQVCGYTVSNDFVENLLRRLKEDLDNVKCEEHVVKFKDFLRANALILHPHHYLMISCKESLFNIKTSGLDRAKAVDISIQDKLETIDLGLDLLKLADILDPGLSKIRGYLVLLLGSTLQQTLSQEIVNRLETKGNNFGFEDTEMSEEQIYSAFHDAMFCFEEAKKIQRLDKTEEGKEIYFSIKSSIHILKDMKKDFERTFMKSNNIKS